MKTTIFILLFAVLAAFSAVAQPADEVVISATEARSLVIGRNMHVILLPSSQTEGLSFSPAALEKLRVRASEQNLEISVASGKEKLTVYVKVGKLATLTLYEDARVETIGFLRSPALHVYADSGAEAKLKITGKISASSLSENEVFIKPVSRPAPIPAR